MNMDAWHDPASEKSLVRARPGLRSDRLGLRVLRAREYGIENISPSANCERAGLGPANAGLYIERSLYLCKKKKKCVCTP